MEGVLNMSEQNLKQVLAKKQSILQGDAERIAKQRAAGKLTARERVAKLLDAPALSWRRTRWYPAMGITPGS